MKHASLVSGNTATGIRSNRPRSAAMDALKIVGTIAVVAGHTWDASGESAQYYTWRVPLFFLLNGYLWAAERPLRMDAQRRVRSLLIPYAVWLFVIGALFLAWLYVRGEFSFHHVGDVLMGGSHIGRPFSAFWFITALFVTVLLVRAMQSLPRWVPWSVALVGLVAVYVAPTAVAWVPLSIGVAVPAMVFTLIGQELKWRRHNITHPATVGIAAAVVGYVPVLAKWSAPLDMKRGEFGSPVLSILCAALISIGLVLFFEALFRSAPARLEKALFFLAPAGLMVLLTHAVPLWALGVYPEGTWSGFAAALFLPYAAALVLHRTPFSALLLGVPRQTNSS